MPLGKTVRIYLADGTPSGIKHAELVNWTGQALVCPRARVAELSNWPDESQRPGVYFLIGEVTETLAPLVYVGEAENVHERLKTHVREKDFWRTAVLFTSKDQNLTKAHVKYLESRSIALARSAARTELANKGESVLPSLPRSDRDAMEEFLGPLKVLLGALGHQFLEALPRASVSAADEDASVGGSHLLLSVPKKKIDARGSVFDDGFVVFQDSVGSIVDAASLTASMAAARQQLLESDAVVTKQKSNTFRTTRDLVFSSPSYAAAMLVGYSVNGRAAWKDEDGRSLRDIEDSALD